MSTTSLKKNCPRVLKTICENTKDKSYKEKYCGNCYPKTPARIRRPSSESANTPGCNTYKSKDACHYTDVKDENGYRRCRWNMTESKCDKIPESQKCVNPITKRRENCRKVATELIGFISKRDVLRELNRDKCEQHYSKHNCQNDVNHSLQESNCRWIYNEQRCEKIEKSRNRRSAYFMNNN